MTQSSLQPANLRAALGRFATGVIIVTIRDAEYGARGLTINSFSSVSLDPPLISWCLDNRSDMVKHFENAEGFTINILSAAQQALANTMAKPGAHSLADAPYYEGAAGGILLHGCLGALECRVAKRIPAGDHKIYLGDVRATHNVNDDAPLLYYRGQYAQI